MDETLYEEIVTELSRHLYECATEIYSYRFERLHKPDWNAIKKRKKLERESLIMIKNLRNNGNLDEHNKVINILREPYLKDDERSRKLYERDKTWLRNINYLGEISENYVINMLNTEVEVTLDAWAPEMSYYPENLEELERACLSMHSLLILSLPLDENRTDWVYVNTVDLLDKEFLDSIKENLKVVDRRRLLSCSTKLFAFAKGIIGYLMKEQEMKDNVSHKGGLAKSEKKDAAIEIFLLVLRTLDGNPGHECFETIVETMLKEEGIKYRPRKTIEEQSEAKKRKTIAGISRSAYKNYLKIAVDRYLGSLKHPAEKK